MTSRRSADHLVSCHADVGECPLYDPTTGALYWVDIPNGHLWHLTTDSDTPERRDVGEPLGSVALIEGGGLLLATRRGVCVLADWRASVSLWNEVEPGLPTQFNDGQCDPQGRFIAGTASPDRRCDGTLYRVDHDGTVHPLLDAIGMSNGLDWSPDGRFLYHVDTLAGTVTRYDWEPEVGAPLNPAPFVTIPPRDGLPDGLTVDDEGYLWLALCLGGEVRRYDSSGRHVHTVSLPTPNVTSCAFGGADMSTLYVTTGAAGVAHDAPGRATAGDVYVVDTATTGRPTTRFPRHSVPSALLATDASSARNARAQ